MNSSPAGAPPHSAARNVSRKAIPRRAATLSLLVLALAPGCRRPSPADYVPDAAVGKQALAAALDAWKAGQPMGTIAGTSPPVQVLDSTWQAGRELAAWTLLQESEASTARQFNVRLEFADGTTAERQYVVVGRDPIWVFSQEDYDKLQGN